MKKQVLIKNISYIAIFSALTFVLTYFISIPYGGGAGYFNLSDGLIIFITIYLGPVVGFFNGIIGTALGDLASGFANFIPFTIVAKGLESIATFLLFYFLRKTKYIKFISCLISPLFMVLTYFISYIVQFGISYALTSSGFDLIQGVCGTVFSILLLLLFEKIPYKHYDFMSLSIFKKANKNAS